MWRHSRSRMPIKINKVLRTFLINSVSNDTWQLRGKTFIVIDLGNWLQDLFLNLKENFYLIITNFHVCTTNTTRDINNFIQNTIYLLQPELSKSSLLTKRTEKVSYILEMPALNLNKIWEVINFFSFFWHRWTDLYFYFN